MSFTTIDNVKLFLNKTSLDTNESALATLLITVIDGVIKNYCGWEIAAKDYSKKFDGNGTDTLGVEVYPINAVTAVTIDGVDSLATVSINYDDGELYFDSTTGTVFTSGKLNVSVDFNAGFTTIPDDLTYAASWLVALNFKRIVEETVGISSQKLDILTVNYDPSDIPVMVKHVLDRYRYLRIY